MATLDRLRKRSGILMAIIIGGALIAFIFTPEALKTMFSSGQVFIGEIDGEKIEQQYYNQKIDEGIIRYEQQVGRKFEKTEIATRVQPQIWLDIITEIIFEKKIKELGISLSESEYKDIVQGDNIHPMIQDFVQKEFRQQFSRHLLSQMLSYFQNIEQIQDATQKQQIIEIRNKWIILNKDLRVKHRQEKYKNLVKKSFYITKAEAEEKFNEAKKVVDFDYLVVPYDKITGNVKVSDDEIKKYYKKHKSEYKQKIESIDAEYVVFDVKASDKDIQETKNEIIENKELLEGYEDEQETKDFIYSTAENPMRISFTTKGNLPERLDSIMFNSPKGFIYGPYKEENMFKIVKLIDVKQLPDSIQARHILLNEKSPNKQFTSYEHITNFADTLIKSLKSGADFTALAAQYSADPSNSQKGGDLGWFKQGTMVEAFNDSCNIASIGEYKIAATQFGIHIIQVLGKSSTSKNVKVGIIDKEIIFSKETKTKVFEQVSKFAAMNSIKDKFDKTVKKQKITVRNLNNFTKEDRMITGIEDPTYLIARMFEVENENEIVLTSTEDPYFDMKNKYIIAFVTKIKNSEYTTLEDVKDEIKEKLLKDKKLAYFNNKIKSLKNLDAIAKKYKAEISTAEGISFASFQIAGAPEMGIEPRVIATVVSKKNKKMTKAIKGNAGLFVVKPRKIKTDSKKPSKEEIKNKQIELTFMLGQGINYQLPQTIKNLAKIKDNRLKITAQFSN